MRNSHKKTLVEKLNDKSAIIGIVGLGYVGLPVMLRFVNSGYQVHGIDNDPQKVESLNSGKSYIGLIANSSIQHARENGFKATVDFQVVTEIDALILCLPTPLNRHREPDLSYVINTIDAILPYIREGQAISLESTTYPGTTEEVILPRIKEAGFEVGRNFFLVYSPERENPGNQSYDARDIPKICSGYSDHCLEVGKALYKNVVESIVPVSSLRVAEMTKLLENIHRAVNIGLVNELKIVADRMGIDIHEVISAAATKPFGYTPYYPGPGLGGHCIPIDPFYLTWKAREFGIHTRFIELAGEVNTSMPAWVVGKTADALNKLGKPINRSKILVLGIAYKKNVDDIRESPAAELMRLLTEKGAIVEYSDPHISVFPKMRKYHFNLSSIPLSSDILRTFDCVLIATDHDAFDYELIKTHAALVIDTRGVYRELSDNIVKA